MEQQLHRNTLNFLAVVLKREVNLCGQEYTRVNVKPLASARVTTKICTQWVSVLLGNILQRAAVERSQCYVLVGVFLTNARMDCTRG